MGGRNLRDHLNFTVAILIAAASTLAGQETALAGEQAPASNRCLGMLPRALAPDADYNGDDITRPECKFQIRLEGKTSGTTSTTDSATWYLQTESIIDLKSEWGFSWLVQLPITSKSSPISGSTDLDREFGVGDIEIQAALFRPINERWAYGFGPRFVVPSGGEKLGSGKWQIMPAFGIRYSFLEFGSNTYFVPKVRYAVSIGGDPSRRNISEVQMAPTFNIGLPNRWFVTLYPSYDIRINYGEPSSGQTGRLFFPIDASVGRKISDNVVVSLEGSVPVIKDYPVYDFKTELRMSAKF